MPGTPLLDGQRQSIGTSAAGHMWYRVADAGTENSYGFAPKEHGASSGPGLGYRGDTVMYQDPFYSRTLEITPEQYTKLKAFGEAAVSGDWRYFKGEYHGATNSCVDFTWGALKHAGFTIHRPEIRTHDGTVVSPERTGPIEDFFEGRLQPARNKVDIQQLVDPVPGSPLNGERSNPPPDRTLLQMLISEQEQVSPDQRVEAQRFKGQLGERLGQLGMSEHQVDTLAAAAVKEQTRFASQGAVQFYLLSKDASTIAMRQAFPPLREFSVERALGQSEQDHWRETMAMSMEAATFTKTSPEPVEALTGPSQSPNHPVPSLG
ncbi:MAG: hypothetical protein KDF54_15365 [Hydrogenophaga sp.]|nr:hypothetical protein [Hydrogenophaga sp.]